jgi:hypothetical protein
MAEDAGAFNWAPFYQELADKLVPYRNRQQELISILETLRRVRNSRIEVVRTKGS